MAVKLTDTNNMKNSGIEWIGEIPRDWDVLKVKNLFYISKVKANKKEPIVLSLARSGVKIRDISNNEGQLAESYEEYNPVVPGDLLLNPMDLYSGANCSMSEVSGVISPAYINLRSIYNTANSKFYDYYFKTQYWSMAMFAHGKGVSYDNRWTINKETLLNYYIPYVDFRMQNEIVNVLNDKLEKIDLLIKTEEQQIDKLNEYKQSLITEVVTKGLDKNAPIKDSGIEWIGKIPKHWKEKKVKFIVDRISKGKGITKDEIREDGNTCCVRYGEIYSKYNYSFDKCISRTNDNFIEPKEYFEYGDILCAGTGELIEEIGKSIVYLGKEKCLAGGDIIIIKHKQEPRFLNYALNSIYAQIQKSAGKIKLKVVHISASDIGNIILAIPPIDEQKKIADYIDSKSSYINKLMEIKKKKINELTEYKKSLIYEYVTGKKEV